MEKTFIRKRAANQFAPHAFQTQTVLLNYTVAHIKVMQAAYLDMYYIAAASGQEEISWLGTVRKSGHIYTIEEVILFEQEVEVSTTALTPADIARVSTDLIMSGAIEKVNALKFWGHVHPSNSTSPSGQDESQMDTLSNGNDWFIRGIFGRYGRAEFTFFDWQHGLRFNDVSWELLAPNDESREAEIRGQVNAKVKKIIHPPIFSVGLRYGSNNWPKNHEPWQQEMD
jgi:hypothetical protein